MRRYRLGVLVAREGSDAIRMIVRFGPPRLLIADLALPGRSGFDVIDALVAAAGESRTPVIAWSPSRELREFAMSRFGKSDVRVISGTAPAAPLVSS